MRETIELGDGKQATPAVVLYSISKLPDSWGTIFSPVYVALYMPELPRGATQWSDHTTVVEWCDTMQEAEAAARAYNQMIPKRGEGA